MQRREFISTLGSLLVLSNLPVQSCQKPKGDFLKGKEKILFIGDSITAAAHYVNYFEAYLNSLFPENGFDIINLGLSSETVSGLTENDHPFPRPFLLDRLDALLEYAKPDIVIACYGMNCAIYHPFAETIFEKYRKGIDVLIRKVQNIDAKLVLLSPPPFAKEPPPAGNENIFVQDYSYKNPYLHYDKVLRKYADYIVGLGSNGFLCIDLHKALSPYKKVAYGSDPIHPLPCGHYLIAIAILKGMGIAPEPRQLIFRYEKKNHNQGKESAKDCDNPISFKKEIAPLVLFREFWDYPNGIKDLYLAVSQLTIRLKDLPKGTYQVLENPSLLKAMNSSDLENGFQIIPKDKIKQPISSFFLKDALEMSTLISKKREVEKSIRDYIGHGHPNRIKNGNLKEIEEDRNSLAGNLDDLKKRKPFSFTICSFKSQNAAEY